MKSDPFFSREVQDDTIYVAFTLLSGLEIEMKDAGDLGKSLFFHFPDFFWKFSRSKTFPSADIGMDWRITYTYFHIFVLLHFVTFGLAALSWRLCVRQVVVCAGKSNICRNKDTCSNSFNLQKPLVIFSSGRVQGAQLWEAVCTCSPGVLLFTAPNCTCGSRTPENCASQPSSWRIFVWRWI